MVVGVMQFEILIAGAESLKDKRRVVRSVRDRLHREHQVSVAEVGAHDSLGRAVMGVSCVCTDGKRAGDVLDAISTKLMKLTDGELGATLREIRKPDFDGRADHEPEAIDEVAIAAEMLDHFGTASDADGEFA